MLGGAAMMGELAKRQGRPAPPPVPPQQTLRRSETEEDDQTPPPQPPRHSETVEDDLTPAMAEPERCCQSRGRQRRWGLVRGSWASSRRGRRRAEGISRRTQKTFEHGASRRRSARKSHAKDEHVGHRRDEPGGRDSDRAGAVRVGRKKAKDLRRARELCHPDWRHLEISQLRFYVSSLRSGCSAGLVESELPTERDANGAIKLGVQCSRDAFQRVVDE